jgi:hypothetical protein
MKEAVQNIRFVCDVCVQKIKESRAKIKIRGLRVDAAIIISTLSRRGENYVAVNSGVVQ